MTGGEKAFLLPQNAKYFGEGTRKSLSTMIRGNSPVSEAIYKTVWNTTLSILGSVVNLLNYVQLAYYLHILTVS